MMTEKVRTAIPLLPHQPGCYLMKNADNKVIYVGKAKNLYNRVSQYFLRPQVGKVAAMVSHVDHFETIITKSEKEAFILEMNLIHEYYPRYNILLKDGKHYPYIALKKNEGYLKISRDEKDPHYYYFGPYPTSGYAYKVIDLLNKIFPTRKCRNIPSNPCLYYHLGTCLAPCINKIDFQTQQDLFEKIKSFLDGNVTEIVSVYKEKMLEASKNYEFEKAQEYKELLDAIEHVISNQTVEDKEHISKDIFGYTIREGYLSLAVLTYRKGILLGEQSFIVEQFDDLDEQIVNLIYQYYENHPLPQEIILNDSKVANLLSEVLNKEVIGVTRGKNMDAVEMVSLNARQALDSHFMSARLDDHKESLLDSLGQSLGIKTPYRIELFDNSHLQGDEPVGVVVVFINGEPVKKLYRKFNIRGMEKRDDYASMKEVMKRHYLRLVEHNDPLPDLILTDGGLGQIHAGEEVIQELNLNIPVFGLYKNDKHQTKGLMTSQHEVIDLTNEKNLFFLLVRMQDEVHRFAISFHHQKRSKSFTKSILDDIPGLGPRRQQILLHQYSDLSLLKKASIEELSQFLPKEVAEKVYQKLHS